jgi:hypothetical protein
MGPDETLTDDEDELFDGEEWIGEPDVAQVQFGAKWEDLHESDQRLISMSEGREAYDQKAPTELPQPDRAASVRGLPKVKSGAFPRHLK